MNICFLIGAARSGTTLLGEHLLSNHSEVAYLGEPDYVWQNVIGYQSHDLIKVEEAETWKGDYLKKQFENFMKENSANVLLEKSPSNCFRIPFIKSVFPEAKFIHIIRDGREVTLSASKEWSVQGGGAMDSKELREFSLFKRFFREIIDEGQFSKRFQSIRGYYLLPLYFLKLLKYFRRHLLNDNRVIWGPKFPGLKSVRKRYSLLETCAIQWYRSVIAAESSLKQLDESRVLRVRYEDLIKQPSNTLKDIYGFLNISDDESSIKELSEKVQRNKPKWEKELDLASKNKILNQISFVLDSLNINNSKW